mmetsp:Transcript_35260/g.84240  ORF Transcript_35260/g.84240 Transcript_35260/m.84240 type:complete len:100 (+) Transcript_35260:292-591(+)
MRGIDKTDCHLARVRQIISFHSCWLDDHDHPADHPKTFLQLQCVAPPEAAASASASASAASNQANPQQADSAVANEAPADGACPLIISKCRGQFQSTLH